MEGNFLREFFFEISLDIINVNKILDKYFNIEYGAVVCFIGKVRNINENKKVIGINYDMCDELVLKTFYDICMYYNKIYKDIKIYISHFKGYLKVGYISTLIIVESYNRKNSFVICNMILEDIKNKLPVWKNEHYFFEKSNWINGKILSNTV